MEEEKEKERDKRIFTIICCSFFVLAAVPVFIVSVTSKYPPMLVPERAFKPHYVPSAMLAVVISVSVGLLIVNTVKLIRARSNRIKVGESIKKFIVATPNAILAMAGAILYAIAWRLIGFTLSTIIFIALLSKKLEPERPWKQVIPVAIGLGLFVFFLFVIVFKVFFPDRIMRPIMDFILYR